MTVKHLFPAVEPSLNLDFANSKKLDPRITFTRSSTGTYVDSNGVIKTAAANEARFDHDGATGSSLGLLVEESRTNTLVYSDDIATQLNFVSNASIASNTVTAPDSTSNADTITFTAAGYVRTSSNNIAISGSIWSYSIFLKAGTVSSGTIDYNGRASCAFDLTAETVSFTIGAAGTAGGGIDKLGNGWYRVYVVYDATSNINRGVRIISPSAGTLHAWGIQNEAGSFPTSYIATSGSTVTRSADVASMTGTNFSSWYSQTAGSFIATWDQPVNSSNALTIIAEGGSAFDFTIWTYNGLPQFATYLSHINQNNYAQSPSVAIPINTLQTIGGSYDSAGVTAALNGNTPVTSGSSTTINEGATLIRFGARNSGIFYINGHLARFTYYPFRLTNAQLQALTL